MASSETSTRWDMWVTAVTILVITLAFTGVFIYHNDGEFGPDAWFMLIGGLVSVAICGVMAEWGSVMTERVEPIGIKLWNLLARCFPWLKTYSGFVMMINVLLVIMVLWGGYWLYTGITTDNISRMFVGGWAVVSGGLTLTVCLWCWWEIRQNRRGKR